MSRGIKRLWIAIGGIFVAGVALAAIGFTFGGSGSAWIDRDGLHFGNPETSTKEFVDKESDSFDNVDVELIAADVELVVGSSYGYELTYTGRNEPTIEVSGNTLRVIEKDDIWSINFFGWRNSLSSQAKLTVYVPSKTVLDKVSLSTASGDTVLSGKKVGIKDLHCQSASGSVTLNDLELEQLMLEVVSGDVKISTVSAESATINMVSGKLICTDAITDNLVVDMVSGSARVQGTIAQSLVINTVSGDADFDLTGNKDDYSFSFDRISGDIKVDGRSIDGLTGADATDTNTQGKRSGRIEIDTVSGSVNINFKE